MHTCHARGCSIPVPPRMLCCPRHWAMVPKTLKAEIWATYRPGQEIDKNPSKAYLMVQAEAIAAVAKKEGLE